MADCSDERSSDDDETVDPRIQAELEALNSAADSINKLENELQRAKNKFRQVKSESCRRLSVLYKSIGKKWVLKARPYYELLRQSQKAQIEAQKAAVKFQRANGVYKAAKETVTLAEQRLFAGDGRGKLAFDAAWQEMLNHATDKFVRAEKEKTACDLEHQTKSAEYAAIQQRLAFMLKDIPRTINKAKPFYDLKERLESRLHAERQNAEDLQLALICSKQKYRMALISLEAISDEVHMQRKLRARRLELPLRTPGVGAELDSDLSSELSDMPSASLDIMSETASQVSWDDFSDSRCVSPALSVDFDISDTSWVDNTTSPESEVTSPESSSTGNSLWPRFGNVISRITQEIGKIPPISAPPPVVSDVPNDMSTVTREDVADGAESDVKPESDDAAYSGGWTLPDSFRVSSFPHSQSSQNVLKAQTSETEIGNWGSHKSIPISHSSSSLPMKCENIQSGKVSPPSLQKKPVIHVVNTEDDKVTSAAKSQRTVVNCKESLVNDSCVRYTSVLNHSYMSPFSAPVRSNVSANQSRIMSPAQPTTSPALLSAKPPRPSSFRTNGNSPLEQASTAIKKPADYKPNSSLPGYHSRQVKVEQLARARERPSEPITVEATRKQPTAAASATKTIEPTPDGKNPPSNNDSYEIFV